MIIWTFIQAAYKTVNRILFWPLRRLDKIPWIPTKVKTWIKFVVTWIGHSSVPIALAYGGWCWKGAFTAWLGFVLGATFYNAKESFRSWPPTMADLDHFGDIGGPIVLGSGFLFWLIT